MACCKCNRSGLCKGCACVRAGKSCMNCLPSKLGTCRNTFTAASEVSTTRSSNQPTPATPPTPSISTPDTDTESSTSQPASATVVVSEATTNSTNYAAFSNSCPPPINDAPALPVFNLMSEPNFTWGERDSESFCKELQTTYDEVVHWRKNCFKIPWGNAGKSLVDELCRLYTAFADASALECVALRAAVVLPILFLQQPHRRSKPKELIACLERRLKTWKDGDLESLVEEGRAIQQRLPKTRPSQSESNLARSFANLMFNGKTHAALDLLSNNGKGGVLHIDHVLESGADAGLSVKDVLKAKHPVGQSASPADVPPGTPPQPHLIIFDNGCRLDPLHCPTNYWSRRPFWPRCTCVEKTVHCLQGLFLITLSLPCKCRQAPLYHLC